jgi:thioredoxin 1
MSLSSFFKAVFLTGLLTLGSLAQALEIRPYSGAALADAQKAGKPVALIFHADWCSTCKIQQQTLETLRQETGLDITVLVANYDSEKDLRREHRVRSQSTLIAFRGARETGRAVGDTSADKIRTLLKTAL